MGLIRVCRPNVAVKYLSRSEAVAKIFRHGFLYWESHFSHYETIPLLTRLLPDRFLH